MKFQFCGFFIVSKLLLLKINYALTAIICGIIVLFFICRCCIMSKILFLQILFTYACIKYAKSANILGVFFNPSVSHQKVFQPIWQELSLRGHQVTVVTPNPLNNKTLTNLTEINTDYTYDIRRNLSSNGVFAEDSNVFEKFSSVSNMYLKITEDTFTHPDFRKILQNKEKRFDLIIVQSFSAALLGLGVRFNAPVIAISSMDVTQAEYESIGNPSHPLLYPNLFVNGGMKEMPFIQRVKRVIFEIFLRSYYRYQMIPLHQKLAEKYIDKNMPSVYDLQKNVSLMILTVNKILYTPRPTIPKIIHIRGMHIKPVQPLPADLQEILDEASEGVIYFSLGSNIKSVNTSDALKSNIIEALSELPYKILWKWESDYMHNQPENVITRKWFPQQDVLAHKNIKVFMTQGGLQSIEEAIDRGVPIVGLPFYGDQPENIRKLSESAAALFLDPCKTTKDEIKKAIMEVATNQRYRNKMKEIREFLNDEPMTSMDKVMWWCEFLIRNKGNPYVHSPIADISWFRYLLLDVVIAFLSLILVFVYISYKIAMIFSRLKLNYKEKIY